MSMRSEKYLVRKKELTDLLSSVAFSFVVIVSSSSAWVDRRCLLVAVGHVGLQGLKGVQTG